MAATSAQAEVRAAYQLAKELRSCDAAVNLAYIMLCESADGSHGSSAGPPTGGRNDDALKEALALLWEATTASTSEAAKREAWYLLGLTHEYASALHPPSSALPPIFRLSCLWIVRRAGLHRLNGQPWSRETKAARAWALYVVPQNTVQDARHVRTPILLQASNRCVRTG
jgi:hypothetical protein